MAPSNTLPMHGNEKTMNLNSLVLTNIQSSPYFKVQLYELKTYHQVIDEIYYKVGHLEPWEKGSRKTAGQTGMCGGVRGVGTGGIVSSAFCLLYKLHTLKLTRKQLIGLLNHADSAFIRALGFMYIRFTQPSGDLWEWFEPYLDDEEQLDVKAGGGHVMTIGELVEHFLTKLDWYSTLFPRIAVPVQKQIELGLRSHKAKKWQKNAAEQGGPSEAGDPQARTNGKNTAVAERPDEREARCRPEPEVETRTNDRHSARQDSRQRSRSRSPRRSRSRGRRSSRERHRHSHSRRSPRDRSPRDRSPRDRRRSRSHSKRQHSPSNRRSSSRDRDHSRRERQRDDKHRRDRRRSASSENRARPREYEDNRHSRRKHSESEDEFQRDLRKEMERVKREKEAKQRNENQ